MLSLVAAVVAVAATSPVMLTVLRCKHVSDMALFVSLRHSVNGDFCGRSRFVLWHENLTTFVS